MDRQVRSGDRHFAQAAGLGGRAVRTRCRLHATRADQPGIGSAMAELDDVVYRRLKALCSVGDALAEQARYPEALEKYWAAWNLLPEPQTQWKAATWILAAIGDANFLSGDFGAGRDN